MLNRYRDEAVALEKDRRVAPSASTFLGVALGHLIRFFFKAVWAWKLSLTYIAVVVGLTALWGYYGLALGLGLTVGLMFWSKSRPWGFYFYDWNKIRASRLALRDVNAGNDFLVQTGLVPENDTFYPVSLQRFDDRVVFTLSAPIVGLSPEKFITTMKAYKTHFNAESVKITDLGSGALEVVFWVINPLDTPLTIDAPAVLNVEKMSVPVGKNAEGESFELGFKEVAGSLVGGIPGSGKTAAVSSFLTPLALNKGDVAVSIIDCKGGSDWSAYENVVKDFISIGSDLTPARDLLKALNDEMVARVATNAEVLGESNFWNVAPSVRRDAARLFRFVVIDEAHELFETTGKTKEEKEIIAEITRYAVSLVKRGRSAGISVMFITQKPTADSIPTAIRDNCALKVALKMNTAEAEKAVLGGVPDDLEAPRAVEIPTDRRGGAVVVNDRGMRESIRFSYFPETQLKTYLSGEVMA